MTKICTNKNRLIRGGTSQKERLLDAFGKDYVHIDEHTFSDLLVFAKKYADRLKYYNIDNLVSGDWSDFFSSDVSFLIAIIAENDLSAYERGFELILNNLKGTSDPAVDGELEALYEAPNTVGGLLQPPVLADLPAFIPSFKQVFDYILSLATHLDRQVKELPDSTALKSFAQSVIRQHCRSPLKKLLGVYKTGLDAAEGGSPDFTLLDNDRRDVFPSVSAIQPLFTQDVVQKGLSEAWFEADAYGSLSDLYDALVYTDYAEVYGNLSGSITTPGQVEQLARAALESITAVFESLGKAIAQIVFEAPKFLDETLDEWPEHQAHVALYLVFLKLFRFAQDRLNGLKERHVDYYYKEVLRLKEKGATPDEVHLVLQLAKHVEDYLLKEKTAFKGGKDGEGKEVVYKMPDSTALNKAQIAQLKSIYHTKFNGKIYAAPVVNSEDGQGAELTSADGQWKPFGPVTRYTGDATQAHPEEPKAPVSGDDEIALFEQLAQVAETGFAIASPNLFLREGERTISLTLTAALINETGEAANTSGWRSGHFKILLTSEEGWLEKTPTSIPTFSGNQLRIICHLSADDPPVLPYDPEIHLDNFPTSAPIVKVLLQESNGTSIYNELRKLEIRSVHTKVEVEEVKDLIVQNEVGRLDLSKPLTPFGAQPRIGSAFIIGNNEVFQKKLTEALTINLVWDGLEDVANVFKPSGNVQARVEYLENNAWKNGIDKKSLINASLSSPQSSLSESTAGNLAKIGRNNLSRFDYSPNTPYSVRSKDGYIRLALDDSFGHQDFLREYPKALIQFSVDANTRNGVHSNFWNGSKIVLTDPPYAPTFKELSLSYTAESSFDFSELEEDVFEKREEQFFHVHAFGQSEEHPLLNQSGQATTLIPQYDYEGNLYLGVKDVLPQQSVSILFQVAEGSANPLAEKQEVDWFYLYNNNWVKFESADYADQTNGLLQSGVIQFFLPRKINSDNSWLPSGFTWLRAGVATSSDAISNLVGVEAQAVKVRFADQDNAEDFLATPLEAGTIKKLLRSDASIKKIAQPYSSFGGSVKEQRSHFYKRASERLRHKDRAISIWDYERLVLEAFPELYKVKCLNHTELRKNPDDPNRKFINGLAPGYVLFIAVPDLKNRNAVDPLKPYTSLNTLDQIKQFLQKRTSPHVRLDVVNPLFESVQLEFEAQFHPGKDFTIYKKILEQEIIAFLSPWAFEEQESKDIEFGGSICKSVLLDFVEERPYVDFVTEFKMNQLTGPDLPDHLDIEEAVASTPRSILVSNETHTIIEQSKNCI